MAKTKIEWAERVWNPIAGCTKVSPGCENCYAERTAKRLQAMGIRGYAGTIDDKGHWTGQINSIPEALKLPLAWKKPSRIFVSSMSDLFHPAVSYDFVDTVFGIMDLAYWHTFLILTKRAERMYKYLRSRSIYILKNVWLGVSVEKRACAEQRIPLLLQTPAAVRFISAEPLLGPIDLRPWLSSDDGTKLDWVIVGGESGPHARPMLPDWVRSMRDQCVSTGTPFLLKQWGDWSPKSGGDMIRTGKKDAGRLLDGQIWDQYPEHYGSQS